MTLARLQDLVTHGRYSLGPHALSHADEDGFVKEQCIGAILAGRILEEYPAEKRWLILGRFHLAQHVLESMHVVCDFSNPEEIRIVTAYVPRPPDWYRPWQRGTAQRR